MFWLHRQHISDVISSEENSICLVITKALSTLLQISKLLYCVIHLSEISFSRLCANAACKVVA